MAGSKATPGLVSYFINRVSRVYIYDSLTMAAAAFYVTKDYNYYL